MAAAVEALEPAAVALTETEGTVRQDESADAPADGATQPEAVEMVTCRRCRGKIAGSDAVFNGKFRADLRWTCKACHALQTQLQRHGIDVKSALSESEAVAFFLDAKAERENSSEGRLQYSQARGLLKQRMIQSSSRVSSEGEAGEFQPLSFWELRGYDTEKIEQSAESKLHPLLGMTYKVNISRQSTDVVQTITEERLLKMEADARQRVSKAAPAEKEQSFDLEMDKVVETEQKKRKSPEEKQAAAQQAKVARAEQKKRQKLETLACSAAAKCLPKLKATQERLNAALLKVTSSAVALPEDSAQEAAVAKEQLGAAIANGTSLLSAATSGKAAEVSDAGLLSDKELQTVLKDANAAVRTVQAFCKANKLAAPKAKGKAKAKAAAMAGA